MKMLIIVLTLLVSISAKAELFRLKESLCGEIDPYVIGDACIIILENKTKESVLIANVDFMVSLSESELTKGDYFDLDSKALAAVDHKTSMQMKRALKRSFKLSRKAKFFYLDQNDGLKSISIEKKTRKIICEAKNASGDFSFKTTLFFSATLEAYGDFSSLKDLAFQFLILDGDNTWAEGSTVFSSLLNTIHYNPQVYLGYDKFHFWSNTGRYGYGYFDLIIPTKSIIDNDQAFNAQVIMTAINDHHGDSIRIECF